MIARKTDKSEHKREDPSEATTDLEGVKSNDLQIFGNTGVGAFAGAGAGAGTTPSMQDVPPVEGVVFAGQLVHTTAPAPEYMPGAQATQLVDPDVLANKPTEQGAHKPVVLEGSDLPVAEKVPAEQVCP